MGFFVPFIRLKSKIGFTSLPDSMQGLTYCQLRCDFHHLHSIIASTTQQELQERRLTCEEYKWGNCERGAYP